MLIFKNHRGVYFYFALAASVLAEVRGTQGGAKIWAIGWFGEKYDDLLRRTRI